MRDPLRLLVHQLQGAYSGELAAGFAYRGHWHSVSDAGERVRIHEIENDEWHHRELVGGMLRALGEKPSRVREVTFFCIGKVIGVACHIGGRFFPMYGAGRLERNNIVEYEIAAVYAHESGHDELIECLLMMAEVEWEHEKYFRERVVGHPLLRVLKLWKAAPAKETIRENAPIPTSPERSTRARASAGR